MVISKRGEGFLAGGPGEEHLPHAYIRRSSKSEVRACVLVAC